MIWILLECYPSWCSLRWFFRLSDVLIIYLCISWNEPGASRAWAGLTTTFTHTILSNHLLVLHTEHSGSSKFILLTGWNGILKMLQWIEMNIIGLLHDEKHVSWPSVDDYCVSFPYLPQLNISLWIHNKQLHTIDLWVIHLVILTNSVQQYFKVLNES